MVFVDDNSSDEKLREFEVRLMELMERDRQQSIDYVVSNKDSISRLAAKLFEQKQINKDQLGVYWDQNGN